MSCFSIPLQGCNTAEAPKVIARFGKMVNLVSQVLEPTIGNYFRDSVKNNDVIAFLSTRKERLESNGNGGGNAMEGLLGLKLMEMMNPEKKKDDEQTVD